MSHPDFCPLDLGDWLELCNRAAVPTIGGRKVAEIAVADITRFDEPGPHQERIAAFYGAVKGARQDGWMMRWSCCAGADLKGAMARGETGWREAWLDLPIDDFRAYDIVSEFPRPMVAAWRRPWMRIRSEDGWPLEFRAFVSGGRLRAISSYYPQRPLPLDLALPYLGRIGEAVTALLGHQMRPLLLPAGVMRDLPAGDHWTADFAVLQNGQLVFLEGGPPHLPRWGAHPCCFPAGEVDGIALHAMAGAEGGE